MSRYIDADEALEQIRKKLGVKSLDYLLEAERQIVAVIQSMPSIDIEPKRGEWMLERLDNYKLYKVACSCCGWWGCENYDSYVDISDFAYCPNCGARMKGADDE